MRSLCISSSLVPLLLVLTASSQETCKSPAVEERLLADDVRLASPFYVIALPRNFLTERMDSVCYTYFDYHNGTFFHIMSVSFKNIKYSPFFTFKKEDIVGRKGLAEAKSQMDTGCVYHDYTLKPVCNGTVFILYRCFISGNCIHMDIGQTSGVDVRVVLAAQPRVETQCIEEVEASLKNTSIFRGGDYVILPRKLRPHCKTSYNNLTSLGYPKA
ncbi:hypothetical protein J6590_026225 [Homalodisca vitripennis]|nr:hypothetical protein J6590_026225 [Homalodisca vitripennis]